jgi:BlaI family transcriptional regulator, penicillinase repressor
MARPRAKELTERELELMHIFWDGDEMTAQQVRDWLEAAGRPLAYTTVATLVRILLDKQFLEQTHHERPFRYRPARSFEDVSGGMLSDLVDRVFGGSRKQLLIRLMDERLSDQEREVLGRILQEEQE